MSKTFMSAVTAVGFFLLSSSSWAAVFPLERYGGVAGTTASVEILDLGTSASFRFVNSSSSPAGSSIAGIKFQISPLTSLSISDASAGVLFSPGSLAGGANPPGWLGTEFEFAANPPPSSNGVNPGQFLTLVGNYAGTFANLVNSLVPGGIWVQILSSDGGDGSAQHVVTPVPAALPLLLTALGGLLGFRWLRRRDEQSAVSSA
jgi:hypothetical protein